MSSRFPLRRFPRGIVVLCLSFALSITLAHATYHTFRIEELYSNSSGTIQFIELQEVFGLNGQEFVTEAPDIKSGLHNFTFSINLPSSTTANKDFLMATAGFAALPGAPTPDYVIPSSFFNPAGDTLQYGSTGPDGVVDLTTFSALPSQGNKSLTRIGTSGNNYSITSAVAHTFNGSSFVVPIPEPSSGVILGTATFLLLMLRMRGCSNSNRTR